MDDRAVVSVQIERPSRAEVDVAARCHLGLPVVARMPPRLDDGTPFPTRFWLTCPLAVRRIDRLEAAGGVRAMTRRAGVADAFKERLDAAHARYAGEREAAGGEPAMGGVGGTAGPGVKCLHAHYADHAVGNDNPVGEVVAPWVEPLDCVMPCVVPMAEAVTRNPSWREPT